MNITGVTNLNLRFDLVNKAISNLRLLIQQSTGALEEFELGLIQQFLDEESLYIKQIPCVSSCFIIGRI